MQIYIKYCILSAIEKKVPNVGDGNSYLIFTNYTSISKVFRIRIMTFLFSTSHKLEVNIETKYTFKVFL